MTLSKNILEHSKSGKPATPAIQRGWAKAAEELESKVKNDKTCNDCKYLTSSVLDSKSPCSSCDDDFSNWELNK